VALRLKVAQRLGILSCRGSRMAVLPAALDDKQPALEGVQVSSFLQSGSVCMQLQQSKTCCRSHASSISWFAADVPVRHVCCTAQD
jgi:hypothetical protein